MRNPPHPGLSVRHDCLEPLGLSVTEAAGKLGISRKQLSGIVNCHAGISAEMAIRLDKAFVFEKWKLSFYIDIQNVYNNRNPEGYMYNYDFTESTYLLGLPILPIIGFKGEF